MPSLKCWMCGGTATRDELSRYRIINDNGEVDHVLVCLPCLQDMEYQASC